MRVEDISSRDRETVRAHMVQTASSTGRVHVFLRQQRESKTLMAQHAKERAVAGIEAYRPKQEIYNAVVRTHLDGCEAGEYPTARSSASAVAGDKAEKLLRRTYNRRQLRKALRENGAHPGMKRIHAVADNSTITATISGSVSSCLGALANSHKLARRLERIEAEQDRARGREKELLGRIASLEARRDLEDEGKDWRDEVGRILATEPAVSKRELGRRVGVSEGAIRKHLKAVGV